MRNYSCHSRNWILRVSRINELATWNNLQLQYQSFFPQTGEKCRLRFQGQCRLKRLLFIILQPLKQQHLQWRSLCTRWSSARESEPSNTTVSPHVCVQVIYQEFPNWQEPKVLDQGLQSFRASCIVNIMPKSSKVPSVMRNYTTHSRPNSSLKCGEDSQ